MNDYFGIVTNRFPDLLDREIKVKESIIIKPYENWNKKKPSESLFWWRNYNNIKHGRVLNHKNANLESVLNLLGGLFMLEMYIIKDLSNENGIPDIPEIQSKLFKMNDWSKISYYNGYIMIENN